MNAKEFVPKTTQNPNTNMGAGNINPGFNMNPNFQYGNFNNPYLNQYNPYGNQFQDPSLLNPNNAFVQQTAQVTPTQKPIPGSIGINTTVKQSQIQTYPKLHQVL